MRDLALTLAVLGSLVTGCLSAAQSQLPSTRTSPSGAGATPSAKVSAVPTPDVMGQPTIEGPFAVGPDEHELEIRCYGTGEPTIVFEAGNDSGGIQSFPAALVRPLAQTNRTCLYDRLGTGSSDLPTAERRTVDDVAADLQALLTAAEVAPPYLLVGQSGGGNIAVWYAAQHGDDVAGLVLIDVGKDDPNTLAQEFPGEQAWGGPEHIDNVDAARMLANMNMPIGEFPVLVITADQGQGDPDRPSGWRELSPRAREIVMHGGHDLHEEIPADVAEEIRSILDEL
ncbi:MAG: hypothetical protein QOF68_48 [Gaiellales bacterium]|nr:hypothetical protein [Gaiellales bacterium]